MNRKGFSLIEVLVATALLVMVVGMIGFVFRQSSMSWDSGIRRAEGISQVRAVMGAIERDLRLAVDAREFGYKNDFTASRLKFVILADPDAGSDDRVPMLVEYSSGAKVERSATRLECSKGKWSEAGGREKATLLEGGSSVSPIEISYHVVKGDDSQALPVYVTINAELDVTEEFSGLEVRSYGPNGKKDEKTTSDDIVVK